jgi:hypothetical protein
MLLLTVESALVLVLVYGVVRTAMPPQRKRATFPRVLVARSDDGTSSKRYRAGIDLKGSNEMGRAGETGSSDTPDYTVKAKLRDVEQVLRRATIKPYRVGGQTIGLRMTRLEKIKSAKSLGIESGDVIRSVNGHRLTSKKKAYQVFKKARSKPNMRVEFLRGNEVNRLLISFK